MYNTLKKKIKALIPEKFLFENELLFRSIYGMFYKGNNHQCNICNKKSKTFINLSNDDLLCPFCGSLSRTRRLFSLIRNNLKGNVLHFSPSRSIYRTLKKEKSITYFSTDFENQFLADYKYDITQIKQPKETFDLIICYHVLEHIVDDKKAMSELYRVLKPNGTIYIQTPFKEGDIYEDYSITSPLEREKHFGQNDHVRIYSIDGLTKRLENSGFKTTILNLKEDHTDVFNGFKSPETVITLTKPRENK